MSNPVSQLTTSIIPRNPVVFYLKEKSGLPQTEIERKLLEGQTFEIKGQGNLLDTQLMEYVLQQNDFYQKPYQKQLKDEAMKFIKSIVEEWSVNIAKIQKKINKDQLPNYTAKILPFGSYVLDLRSNSSDIDFVCVGPNFIQRQTHFFDGLASLLTLNPQVKDLTKRKNAKVPIITFDYKQINIDISYCRLETQRVPRDIQRVISLELLDSIKEDKSKVALLGRKNNLMILELAGQDQTQNFKQTLRVIKVWAKNRGISSNAMGFLGGISWAIMLAKICQIFPYHRPSKLLAQFFNIYKLWGWKDMPIQLLKPFDNAFQSNIQDKKTIMTVVTPGSYYNSTERVNQITFEAIKNQIIRASQILSYKKTDFQTLCQKSDFVNSFPIFIEIDICGKNLAQENKRDFKQFQGTVEARIINLLQRIIKFNKKQIEQGSLKIVPNPKNYKKNDKDYEFCSAFFMGTQITKAVNLRKAVAQWARNVQDVRKKYGDFLNVRIFQCKKQEFLDDVQILQAAKKKQEREDPRLALLGLTS